MKHIRVTSDTTFYPLVIQLDTSWSYDQLFHSAHQRQCFVSSLYTPDHLRKQIIIIAKCMMPHKHISRDAQGAYKVPLLSHLLCLEVLGAFQEFLPPRGCFTKT